MSSQILSKMLELIKTGQISHEDVIEELINNGLLPVDVTKIGKIPISVGTFETDTKPRFGTFEPEATKPRVEPLLRLQNLRARNPVPSSVAPPPPFQQGEMVEVDLSDPDGDFENMNEHLEEEEKMMKGVDPGLTSPPQTSENPKDIEVLDSMMKLYDQVFVLILPKLIIICS